MHGIDSRFDWSKNGADADEIRFGGSKRRMREDGEGVGDEVEERKRITGDDVDELAT